MEKLAQELVEHLVHSGVNWAHVWHEVQRYRRNGEIHYYVTTPECLNAFKQIVEPNIDIELQAEWMQLCDEEGVGVALRRVAQDSLTEYYFEIADLIDEYGY